MSAKYILIGGAAEKANPEELSRAIFKDSDDQKTRILVCLFARNPFIYDWQQLFRESQQFFDKLNSKKNDVAYELANEKIFAEQVMRSKIIYFAGGDSIPLYAAMARIGRKWTKLLADKTIIGTSASTDMLSSYCYDVQQDGIDRGLGLVPIKTIVHYEANSYAPSCGWELAKKLLGETGNSEMPVYALHEGEFITITA